MGHPTPTNSLIYTGSLATLKIWALSMPLLCSSIEVPFARDSHHSNQSELVDQWIDRQVFPIWHSRAMHSEHTARTINLELSWEYRCKYTFLACPEELEFLYIPLEHLAGLGISHFLHLILARLSGYHISSVNYHKETKGNNDNTMQTQKELAHHSLFNVYHHNYKQQLVSFCINPFPTQQQQFCIKENEPGWAWHWSILQNRHLQQGTYFQWQTLDLYTTAAVSSHCPE